MKFYNNLAMLQVLLKVDVLLGSNQHEGLLITQVLLSRYKTNEIQAFLLITL